MIKKISVVPVGEGVDPNSLKGSLLRNGYHRFPGTYFRIQPYAETDGSYRTGLDENALYIRKMADEQEREQEKAYVKSLLKFAQEAYGDVDLSSRSEFYKKMTDELMNTDERCPFRKLEGGDNIFNFENKEDIIVYAYVRVHPFVAPSKEALKLGAYSHCRFYVNDEEIETEKEFKINQRINKAVALLDVMSIDKQKKVARQLGLPVSDSTSERQTYNLIDEYIKSSKYVKYSKNVELFMSIAELNDQNLAIRDLVKQAITYNVLRKTPDGKIHRGSNLFAASEREAVNYLMDVDHQEDLITIEDELKSKKTIKQ